MDCKSTILLRTSELLWCTAIIGKSTWQDAAFTERIDEISRRVTDYPEKARSLLKNMLEVLTVVIPDTAEILLPTCRKELMLKVLKSSNVHPIFCPGRGTS